MKTASFLFSSWPAAVVVVVVVVVVLRSIRRRIERVRTVQKLATVENL